MLLPVNLVKEEESQKKWYKLPQECINKVNSIVENVKEKEKILVKKINVKHVKDKKFKIKRKYWKLRLNVDVQMIKIISLLEKEMIIQAQQQEISMQEFKQNLTKYFKEKEQIYLWKKKSLYQKH